jgi:hypothetical protein
LSTYYDILRVPEDADDKEIKAAYRQAALAYHPDHIPKGVSKRMRDDASQTWLEIQEAFSVLSDPEKREEYDTLLEEMRRSEEAEMQFEPATPSPRPASPEPAPPDPTPPATPQPIPQPAPQTHRQSTARSVWLWVCFQAGRRWRHLCWIVTGVLFILDGAQDSETWGITSLTVLAVSLVVTFLIVISSGLTWKDKGRYILNTITAIALFITVITTTSIPSPFAKIMTVSTLPSVSPAPAVASNTLSSAALVANALKRRGFNGMPPACENVPPKELDSCLAKVKADSGQKYVNHPEKEDKILALIRNGNANENSWLTQLPEEYLFACFETDRSRCSTSITHLKYQPKQNVLLETEQFQDYYQDTDKKLKPSPGRWYATCPLHQDKNGHWTGECTYSLHWNDLRGHPNPAICGHLKSGQREGWDFA